MNKEPKTKLRIRFGDCDPFGHLNNARYLDYLLNGREDHLREAYQLDMYQMAKEIGVSWVVGKTEIIYRKPALMNEVVTIKSRLIEYAPKWVKVEISMWDESEEKLMAIMWGKFIHISMKSQRPSNHNEQLLDLFQKVHLPLYEKSIDERTKNLTNQTIQS